MIIIGESDDVYLWGRGIGWDYWTTTGKKRVSEGSVVFSPDLCPPPKFRL